MDGQTAVQFGGNLHQVVEFFRSSTVDVVVLDTGSSVSTVVPLTHLLKTANPGVPLLLITDNAADADNEPEANCFDAVMSRLKGPAGFAGASEPSHYRNPKGRKRWSREG